MKRSLLTLFVLLSLTGVVLAGCGDSKKNDTASTATRATESGASSTGTTTSAGSPSSGAAAIVMQNTAFSPAETTVKVGQKITWTNQDGFDHNVTPREGGESFKPSGDFGQGGTFSFTPTKAGKIEYTCTIHPGMDGEITVTK